MNPPRTSLLLKILFVTVFLLTPVLTASVSQLKLITNIPHQYIPTNSGNVTISLTNYVKTDAAANFVWATTSLIDSNNNPLGFSVQLYPSNAPQTVANFLAYVNDDAYENTLIHRSIPGFIIQTGGYTDGGTANTWNAPIATFSNTVLSEATNGLHNTVGTISMALEGSDSNSATDQWFINLTNNTSILDSTNTRGNPPFTVFAKVIGGMPNVLAIAGLQTCSSIEKSSNPVYPLGTWLTNNGFTSNSLFYDMPLLGVTTNTSVLSLSQLVYLAHVATNPYYVTSTDPNSYSAQISNSTLTISYTGGTNPPAYPVTISLYTYDTNALVTNTSFHVWNRTNVSQTISFTNTNATYTNGVFYPLQAWPLAFFDGYTNITQNVSVTHWGCLTNKNGSFYVTGAGYYTIKVVSPAVDNFINAATNYYNIVVGKASSTITFPDLTTNASNTVTFSTNPFIITNPPTSSSGLPVSLSIEPGSPANWKVTNSQLLFTGTGTVTLIATQSGNSNYLSAPPVTNTLVVQKAPQTITFPNVPNQILSLNNPSPLVPLKAVSSSGLSVHYQVVSGNTKGFVTNSSIKITGIGSVAVKAYLEEGPNYLAADPVTNTVTAKYAQTLKPFGKIPARTFTYPYDSFRITVPTTDALTSTNVILSATPTNIATITSNSIVTITGAGTVTLTASQAGDDFYFPASVSTSFVVTKAHQTITPFTPISAKTNGIASFPIIIPSASSALPLTITASGAGYASTNGTNVMITLINSGKVTVTATQSGNANYLAAKAVSTTFTVAKGNQSINFPAIDTNHVFADTFALQATAVPSGLPVSYKIISGSNVARLINGNSINIIAPAGTVTIVASQAGSSGYNAAASKTNSFTIAPLQTHN